MCTVRKYVKLPIQTLLGVTMFLKTVLASCLCSLSLYASDRVKVDVTSKVDKNQVTLNFKVASIDSLKLNFSAPWHLKLADSKLFDKTDYTEKDFNQDLPGFVLTSKDASKASSLKYE